jgi:hypothetical protein
MSMASVGAACLGNADDASLAPGPHWRTGAAAELYLKGIHPRIVTGPADLARLREDGKSGDPKQILDALRLYVRPLIRQVQEADNLPKLVVDWDHAERKPGTAVVMALQDIALVGVLDEDPDAIEAIRRILAISPDAGVYGQKGPRSYAFGKSATQLALAYDLLQPRLTPEERTRFCAWAYTHCIRANLDELAAGRFMDFPGSNLPINAMITSLMMQLAIDGEPGVPDMTAERAKGLLMLEAALNTAIGPDGYPEEDLCYGTSTVAKLAQVVEALRRAGWFDVYTACPRYARFGRAVLHFLEPWGERVGLTGDNVDDVPLRELVLARQAQETGDPSLLWLSGTLGTYTAPSRRVPLRAGLVVTADTWSLLMCDAFRHARPPAELGLPTAFCDRGRGIVSFRSGWGPNETLVVFDGSQRSPAGPGHAHASCGHFSLSALGEYFAIDTGRYNMEQSCHNVVLINGKSGRSLNGEWTAVKHDGALTGYTPGEFVDTASVDSSLQHNCYWARRRLWLVKGTQAPAYVVVADDINHADDWAEYWWQVHTMPGNTITLEGTRAAIRGARHGNLLDVHFCLPAAADVPKGRGYTLALDQDIATLSATNYIKAPAEDAAAAAGNPILARMFQRPRLLAKIGGLNGRVMSFLLPRREGQTPAAVEALPTLPGAMAARIRFADIEDIVILAFHHGLLAAGDVRGRGTWCIVRRDRRTGEVLRHAMGEGLSLSVGRQELAP